MGGGGGGGGHQSVGRAGLVGQELWPVGRAGEQTRSGSKGGSRAEPLCCLSSRSIRAALCLRATYFTSTRMSMFVTVPVLLLTESVTRATMSPHMKARSMTCSLGIPSMRDSSWLIHWTRACAAGTLWHAGVELRREGWVQAAGGRARSTKVRAATWARHPRVGLKPTVSVRTPLRPTRSLRSRRRSSPSRPCQACRSGSPHHPGKCFGCHPTPRRPLLMIRPQMVTLVATKVNE